MNILVCNNRYFPSSGPETYLFAVTALLEQHGHKVIPLAADYAQSTDTPYRRYFVPPPVDANSVYFKQYKDQLTVGKQINLAMRAAYYRPARLAAERAIREQHIDLVYLLQTVNVLSPSIVDAAYSYGIPTVMRLSDFNLLCPAYVFAREGRICQECLSGYQHALQHRCLQHSLPVTTARVLAMVAHNAMRIYHKVHAFIAPSRFLAGQMEHFKPARERIYHVPSFVDETLLGAAKHPTTIPLRETPHTDSESRPYVLYFGRVAEDKGVEVALRAYAGVDRNVDLVIAGESGNGYRERMAALAVTLGVPHTRFLGFVRGTALSELIAGALCVLAPSLCFDNAPMSVYESLAHGKAIIGSDLGGISEQLNEGCGLLVPPGDPVAVRAAMRQVIDDPALRHRLEQAALKRARTEYAPERHYQRLMEVFEAARAASSSATSAAR